MAIFHESISGIALARVSKQKQSATVAIRRDTHVLSKSIADLERPAYYSDHNSVVVDLKRVSRIKPFYRKITNASQPFTYPDGRPISCVKVTLQLCDRSQRPVQATDYETGDTIIGNIETWTDEFGEINEYVWPNGRSMEDTFYLFHIDFPGMDDAMLYVPDHPSILDFKIPWSHRNSTYTTAEEASLSFSVTPAVFDSTDLQCSININII